MLLQPFRNVARDRAGEAYLPASHVESKAPIFGKDEAFDDASFWGGRKRQLEQLRQCNQWHDHTIAALISAERLVG